MASFGVLGSLISQLGQAPIPQYDPQAVALAQQRLQAGRTTNQTALLELAELQRQLGTQEAARQYQREHPWTVLGGQPPGGAGATALGGLGPAQMPGAGPITQSPLPGMPGQTQTIPAYPDASRYSGVSPQGGGPLPADVGMPTAAPPQSALASLGPARHPLEGLARQNPDAARLVLAQSQAQETQRLTAHENLLKVRLTEAGAVGQLLQGANAGNWDVVKARVSEIAPRLGARLPQHYSQEAVQPYIDSALSVKDRALNQIEAGKINALLRGQDVDMLKLQQQGGKLNYQTDAQGHIVAVPEYANGTTLQARPVLGADGQPIKSLEGQKLTADQTKAVRTQENELRTHVDKLLTDYYSVRDAMGRIEASGADPSAAGDLALITAFMKMLDPTTGVRDLEFKNAATAGGFLEQVKARLGYVQSGQRLSEDMRNDLLTRSRKLYEQYENDYGQVKQQYRDLTTRLGGNPANVVLETGSTAAKASTTGKPVAQMSLSETEAEIAALKARNR